MEPTDNQQIFEMLAASLRANSGDIHSWLPVLSRKLAAAFPSRSQIFRGGFLGGGPVIGVMIDLDTWQFSIREEHGRMNAERSQIVRGVALKTERLSIDMWIEKLSLRLSEMAAENEREANAIRALLE